MCITGGNAEAGGSKIQEDEVPQVQEFQHLQSTVQEDGGAGREVARRITAG